MDLYLDKLDWMVRIMDDASPNKYHELSNELREMGMDGDKIATTLSVFDKPNHGIVLSDQSERLSLMLIGWHTSWERESNTISQQLHHLSSHIARGCHEDGEPPSCLIGYIVEAILNAEH